MAQDSPVIKQEKTVTVDPSTSKVDIPQSGTQPSFVHLFVTCNSGKVSVRFYDSDGNEITGTNQDRLTLDANQKWDYDFGIGTATPTSFQIHDEDGNGSEVDYRMERSTAD